MIHHTLHSCVCSKSVMFFQSKPYRLDVQIDYNADALEKQEELSPLKVIINRITSYGKTRL